MDISNIDEASAIRLHTSWIDHATEISLRSDTHPRQLVCYYRHTYTPYLPDEQRYSFQPILERHNVKKSILTSLQSRYTKGLDVAA